jgi:hypothetical protein
MHYLEHIHGIRDRRRRACCQLASSSELLASGAKIAKICKKNVANLKKMLNSNHSPKKGNWWSVETFFFLKKKRKK